MHYFKVGDSWVENYLRPNTILVCTKMGLFLNPLNHCVLGSTEFTLLLCSWLIEFKIKFWWLVFNLVHSRHIEFIMVHTRNHQWFGFNLTGLALSKPNQLTLNRFKSFQTWTESVPKPVKALTGLTKRVNTNRLALTGLDISDSVCLKLCQPDLQSSSLN